jgi:macrolide transport system ATP-binding/permease protein
MFRRKRNASDFDEEIKAHLSLEADELRSEGLSEGEAHRRARVGFGNVPSAQERFRLRDRVEWFDNLLRDLTFSFRQLRKNVGFSTTSIAIVALGIASSVAIFAFVDAVLIKPLPYKGPNRLTHLYESIPLGPRFHLSYPDYLDWKRDNKVFSSLDVYEPFGFMMKTADGLRQTDGARVSAGFFRTLGVRPIAGRDFYYGEDDPKAARTALLSYSAWQKRYSLNPGVVGQSVLLDGDTYTIIGVLPREFSFAPAEPADFWAILKPDACRGCHRLFGVARLKDGISFAAAYADIKTVAQNLSRQYPDSNRDQAAYMLPLTEVIVGDIQPILLVVLSGAGLLLLIAGVNVASLLLVQAEARKREIAVRRALGAAPRRVVAQFITEGMLLAAIGTALGVLGARESMRILAALIPKDMMASMPYLQQLGMNSHVLALAGGLAVMVGTLFAVTPIACFRRAKIGEGLSEQGRTSSGLTWRRFGANLVVIELATAMILLAGAGLLTKSLYMLLRTNLGLQPDHIATIHVQAQREKYGKPEQQAMLVRELLRTLAALPGVQSVGVTQKMPIEDADFTTSFGILGRPDNGQHKEVAIRFVSAGYWTTLKTRLLNGRYFADDEDNSKPKVAIVSEAMATQYFPGEDPVGKQIAFGDNKPVLIIGVIDSIQEGQLDAGPRGAVYLPFYQSPRNDFVVLARTAEDDRSFLPALTSALASVDRGMAIYNPMTMDQKIHDAPSTYLHRSSAWLVGGFAIVALLLGIVGLYGVVAYSVGQRRREIGVRMALGAQRSAVYRLILLESGRLIGIGLGFGLVTSILAASLMRKLLFGVQVWDVSTLVSVGLILGAASLLASFLPARRAASINPTDALRAE